MAREGFGENYKEALRENERNEQYRAWVRQRTETLKSSVSAHDVLRHFGSTLRYGGSDNEEQISCPFHGRDTDPSARVYPESARSSSHVWCFVCQESWDIFALWKKFNSDSEARFTAVLFGLEKAFGIITPEGPSLDWSSKRAGPSDEEQHVMDMLAVCESRLKQAKPNFDMKGFCTVGKLLDHLHHGVQNRMISSEEAEKRARLILDKIGEKIRGA
jgi:hypothetical protein